MGAPDARRGEPQRAAPVRRVGRDLAVQLPDGARGRARGGALVAGNTVVFKPASDTPLLGFKLYEMMTEAGIPQASSTSSPAAAAPWARS